MEEFPLRNASILCLACEDWWYHPPRSRRRFMEVLARHNRVLFVNSIGMRRPSVRHPDFLRRVGRKLRSYSRLVRRAQPNLYVLSPVALPVYGHAVARAFNHVLLRVQIGGVLRALGMHRPITWIGLPTYADLVGRFGSRLSVFQVTDKYDAYHEVRDPYIAEAFDRLARESDVVLVSSRRLESLLAPRNPRTFHVPHGVDFEHFARARDGDLPLPDDLRAIPAPRLGFVGSLDQVVDYELLRSVAQRRPDWRIVLVGPYSGEAAALRPLPNVHMLGARDYRDLPAYLKAFDVCLMPWKQDEWIRYCNPIKTKEYLAAGRQVVTMHYDEVAECERWIWDACNFEEFFGALAAILDRGARKDLASADDWLRASTWETQTARVAEILARRLDEQSRTPCGLATQ
jgi:glycosyltransferase involved in cell wall biosynthesis